VDSEPFASEERYNRFLLLRRQRVNAPYETTARDGIVAILAALGFDFAEQPIDFFQALKIGGHVSSPMYCGAICRGSCPIGEYYGPNLINFFGVTARGRGVAYKKLSPWYPAKNEPEQ